MKQYKSNEEKSSPLNACAPNNLTNEFLIIATDLNMGDTLSKALQIMMRFAIENKNNKEFKTEIKKIR